ncbi:tetratricopeptide repeat protein [Streptomyces sp. NPDC029041]|uniref:tetratricopeptide repeat protein n=1 Tax=Streptomyces sp. NPDC029041 TaxID=3155727 RepID=UPI0033D0CDD2
MRDERIGYVVPLQVDPDGSSHFTAEPIATTPPERQHTRGTDTTTPPGPRQSRGAGAGTSSGRQPAGGAGAGTSSGPQPAGGAGAGTPSGRQPAGGAGAATSSGPQPARGADAATPPEPHPAWGADAATPPEPQHVRGADATAASESQRARSGGAMAPPSEPPHPPGDSATQVLRPVPDSGHGSAPTFRLRAVSEPQPAEEVVPTFELRAVPESVEPAPEDAPPAPEAVMPPGTVAPPTGAFGPPPPMDARPLPVPEARPAPRPAPVHEEALIAADPDPKPTPPRGFDAVAEAVLGDEPLTAPGDPAAPALLAEPVTRINEAVKEGRIEEAAGLAEQTLAQASRTLGAEHPEVLRLSELTAYIAYLAGDPLRAFRLSLDLAGAHRRAGDAEAAYGNVESAATAWRAVRDPALGLELGRDLIGLWTELAAEDGPAAEEVEQLESARARMGRLTERAARNQ